MLLTDIVLAGGINGAELARRALTARPALRVVLMSGYMEDAVRRDDLVEHGARLLQKPFTREQLSTVLGDVLEGRASPQG